MHPSAQALVLTLAALAVSGAQGFRFHRRADPVDNSNSQGLQNIIVTDAQQKSFYIPMHFGSGNGATNTLGLISTVRGDILLPSKYAKNLTGFVTQGKSVAEGPVYEGPVSAGGWTVPDQDIVYYEKPNPDLHVSMEGKYAYAGFSVWPNTSAIAVAFGDWSADTFTARVLAEPNAEPYWTLLINPIEDDRGTDDSFGGVFTIGEIVNLSQIFNVTQEDLTKYHIPDLTKVTQYPHLNHNAWYKDHYYYALIDHISWKGGSATLNSVVPGTPSGKIAAYIDSTYSWIQVPYSVTKELYGGLKNATYMQDTRLWYFECTELTISITIAGYDYPISPLTAVWHTDKLNCVGTFQASPEKDGCDVILGVPFLKNVYASFAYATKRNGEVYDPYAQLMPVTDVKDAHNDWETWYNKWSGSSSQYSTSTPTSPHSSLSYSHSPPYSSSTSYSSPYSSSTSYSTRYSSSTSYSTHYSSSSSYSTHYSSSSSHSPPYSSSTPSSPSASSPTPTNKIVGAVEDDNSEESTSPVKRYLAAIIVASVLGGLAIIGGAVFVISKIRHGRDGKGAYRGLGTPDGGAGPVKVPLYDSEGASGRYGEGGQGRYADPYKDQ